MQTKYLCTTSQVSITKDSSWRETLCSTTPCWRLEGSELYSYVEYWYTVQQKYGINIIIFEFSCSEKTTTPTRIWHVTLLAATSASHILILVTHIPTMVVQRIIHSGWPPRTAKDRSRARAMTRTLSPSMYPSVTGFAVSLKAVVIGGHANN